MIVATRRSLVAVFLVVVAGCSTSSPPVSPSPEARSAAPSPPASSAPSSAPSGPTPTSVPTTGATASSAAVSPVACPDLPQTIAVPSDRLVDLKVVPGADADRLTFVFGNPSLPGPPAPPQGSLQVARPPYTEAASGAAIKLAGRHVAQVRFTNMSLANDVGQPTYAGPTTVTPNAVALQQAVLFDASEGVIGWYVGYDGSGCTALVGGPNEVALVIAHR